MAFSPKIEQVLLVVSSLWLSSPLGQPILQVWHLFTLWDSPHLSSGL